jgi:hypothetical protein
MLAVATGTNTKQIEYWYIFKEWLYIPKVLELCVTVCFASLWLALIYGQIFRWSPYNSGIRIHVNRNVQQQFSLTRWWSSENKLPEPHIRVKFKSRSLRFRSWTAIVAIRNYNIFHEDVLITNFCHLKTARLVVFLASKSHISLFILHNF